MSFLDVRFPENISKGSKGGPVYETVLIVPKSGIIKANANWTYPRHEYDAAYGVRSQTDLEQVIALFHIVQGRAHTFRWKDWADYKSCSVVETPSATDQTIGTGDGSTTEFQLVKTYSFGGESRLARWITKPVDGTVLVAVDGTVQTEGTDYTVDYSTGVITFASAPGDGLAVTVGYEFDVHVRFGADELSISLDAYRAGSASIEIIEQKPVTT